MLCQCNGCGNYFNWKAEKKRLANEKFEAWLAAKNPMPEKVEEPEWNPPSISVADWQRLYELGGRSDVVEARERIKA